MWGNGAYETHVREVQGRDLMMKETTSDTNPTINRGTRGPVACQNIARIIRNLSF